MSNTTGPKGAMTKEEIERTWKRIVATMPPPGVSGVSRKGKPMANKSNSKDEYPLFLWIVIEGEGKDDEDFICFRDKAAALKYVEENSEENVPVIVGTYSYVGAKKLTYKVVEEDVA